VIRGVGYITVARIEAALAQRGLALEGTRTEG
jgi:hypothetical protein